MRSAAALGVALLAACQPSARQPQAPARQPQAPARQPQAPAQVVFVCEHGAAKSVVATAYFNKLAGERGLDVHAIARGADPQDQPSVSAVQGLRSDGLAPGGDLPRPLSADELKRSTRVVAFDCGQPTMRALRGLGACWDDVPATGDDYARARDLIRAHVVAMIEELIAQRASR
jgi:arsenate reductase (thioredoxin)